MKCLLAAAASALMVAVPGSVAARDLQQVLTTKNRSVLLIDRQSVKAVRADGANLREAVLSLDNSAATGGVTFYAADIKMRADCANHLLAVVSSRTYAPDGSPGAFAVGLHPHELARPGNALERAALHAICEDS